MKTYPRIYRTIAEEHLNRYRQMVFLSGPRQVGKTTLGEALASDYLSWDDDDVRRALMAGQKAVVDTFGLVRLTERDRVVVFDEIHKYSRWMVMRIRFRLFAPCANVL